MVEGEEAKRPVPLYDNHQPAYQPTVPRRGEELNQPVPLHVLGQSAFQPTESIEVIGHDCGAGLPWFCMEIVRLLVGLLKRRSPSRCTLPNLHANLFDTGDAAEVGVEAHRKG